MTFHRTGGKGGTRNSRQERHFTNVPNFNKSQGSGRNPQGRVKHNPPRGSMDTMSPKERYKRMQAGIPPRKTLGEHIGSRLIGKSKVTGKY